MCRQKTKNAANCQRQQRLSRLWRLLRRLPAALAASTAVLSIVTAVAWLLLPDFKGSLGYMPVTRIYDSRGRLMRVALGEKDRLCMPVPLSRTGEWTAKALVAGEDGRFHSHCGVDPVAIIRAAWHNLKARKVVSGASTISTLVIKLIEPRPRTMWTKFVEAHHAIQLERLLTKDAILEQYLNRAPFGSNIIGIEAAAWRYFGKPAAELSLAETAMLIGIPQAPSKLRPDLCSAAAVRRRNYVLARMKARGFITQEQYGKAISQRMAITRKPLPFLAPHFCDAVLKEFPDRHEINTTLDLDLQAAVEQALRGNLARQTGITGGAALILDVRTGAVLAMAGSPDFNNTACSGQVNGTMARRSPGSSLKPFAYALALDQGLYSPETVLADVPVNLAGYQPRNFNREFSGPVTVRHALVQSLNIPAILCVKQIGLENFIHLLRSLGLTSLNRPPCDYGLGIAVGTCEVTLFELVNAYACLAGLGRPVRPIMLINKTPRNDTRLLSEEATCMITDILSGDERALALSGHMADADMPRVAWKTGTSAGNRDAWSIAYNPEYVVGVWIGNPDGRPAPALVGASAATPVVYDIFRKLYPPGTPAPWYSHPPGLKTREVCRDSGMVACPHCPDTMRSTYIPGITIPATCTLHAATDTTTHPAAAKPAQASRDKIRIALARTGMAHTLQILSPGHNDSFLQLDNTPLLRQEIPLRAEQNDNTRPVFWFVDKQFYRQATTDETVTWPLERGKHLITCCDSHGNSASTTITVE